MPNVFRFRNRSDTPEQNRNSTAVFAAADGTLKQVDPDGNVSNVAGEGSLPSPSSEGDVLTVVEGDWAGAAPEGGGSQPGAVRMLGPLTVGFADFINDAINGWSYAHVYTPPVGDAALGCSWLLRTPFDDSALPGLGMDVTPLDLSGGGFNTGPAITPVGIVVDLQNVQGAGTGNVGGDYVYGHVFAATTYSGEQQHSFGDQIDSGPSQLGTLPASGDGMPLYINGQLLNGDGANGTIDFYIYVATPALPS